MITLAYKAFYYLAQENNTYSSHFHNSLEFLLPEKEYSFRTEEGEFRAIYGDLFFLRANTLHNQIVDTPPSSRYVLHVDKATISSFSTPSVDILKILEATPSCCVDIRGHEEEFVEILAFLTEQGAIMEKNEIRVTIALLRFFDLLLSCLNVQVRHMEKGEKKDSHNNAELVHAVQEYIMQNLTQRLTLDSISAVLHVSKYYLCHLFSQLTGYSIKKYVLHCRIEYACELLRKGGTVDEAQQALNILSSGYFIRVFKKEVGVSPAEYARLYSQKLIIK